MTLHLIAIECSLYLYNKDTIWNQKSALSFVFCSQYSMRGWVGMAMKLCGDGTENHGDGCNFCPRAHLYAVVPFLCSWNWKMCSRNGTFVQFIFNINNKPFDLSFVQVTQNDNTCRIFAPFCFHNTAGLLVRIKFLVYVITFTLLRYVIIIIIIIMRNFLKWPNRMHHKGH